MTHQTAQSTLTMAFVVVTLAGSIALASAARAGECPAGEMRPEARASGETMPRGVTDSVLGAVPLGKEIKGLDDRELRLRRLTVQPGGVVPWHSHADRPAL